MSWRRSPSYLTWSRCRAADDVGGAPPGGRGRRPRGVRRGLRHDGAQPVREPCEVDAWRTQPVARVDRRRAVFRLVLHVPVNVVGSVGRAPAPPRRGPRPSFAGGPEASPTMSAARSQPESPCAAATRQGPEPVADGRDQSDDAPATVAVVPFRRTWSGGDVARATRKTSTEDRSRASRTSPPASRPGTWRRDRDQVRRRALKGARRPGRAGPPRSRIRARPGSPQGWRNPTRSPGAARGRTAPGSSAAE